MLAPCSSPAQKLQACVTLELGSENVRLKLGGIFENMTLQSTESGPPDAEQKVTVMGTLSLTNRLF